MLNRSGSGTFKINKVTSKYCKAKIVALFRCDGRPALSLPSLVMTVAVSLPMAATVAVPVVAPVVPVVPEEQWRRRPLLPPEEVPNGANVDEEPCLWIIFTARGRVADHLARVGRQVVKLVDRRRAVFQVLFQTVRSSVIAVVGRGRLPLAARWVVDEPAGVERRMQETAAAARV